VGNSNRPTEMNYPSHPTRPIKPPIWWDDFWLMYKSVFTQYSENEAKNVVFKNGRFSHCPLNECKEKVLDILGQGSVRTTTPSWNVL